jgi:hypothetical protein
MARLDTPPGILLTVALLVVYSAGAFFVGSFEQSRLLMAVGIVALVASVGTALLKPWSRWLVYALAAGFVGKLTWSVITAARAGFFGFQFRSSAEILRSLAPSLLMALLSVTCCWIVYRHFAVSRAAAAAAEEPLRAGDAT